MPPFSSTRWRPTTEQRMILKDLYSRGITNPKSSQIQRIASHLSIYGKIHGKNVFYWFQNHKARDRQKLKKKLAMAKQVQQPHHHCYSFEDCVQLPLQAAPNEIRMKHAWSTAEHDLPRDWYDLMMINPTCTLPCCVNRPLETLQLFPLTSPAQMENDRHGITA